MQKRCVVCFCLLINILVAQNEIIINQYSQNSFGLNASHSALLDRAEANIYYKKLWAGFTESPELTQFTIASPIKNKKLGIGLNTIYQQIGLFTNLTAQGNLSYKLKLNSINFLSFGVQVGIKRLQVNFNKINAYHPDEFFDYPKLQSSTLPTADFSVSYKRKNFLAFVSANQLLRNNFTYKDATFQPSLKSQLIPYYLIGLKWDKAISPSFVNTASLIYRSHQGLPIQIEVSDMVTWREKISLGLGYRQSYSAYSLARVQITPNLCLGYSYEYNVKRLNTYTKGGHEINILYKLGNGPKGSESQKKSSTKDMTELYEQIDLMNQKLEQNTKKVDSLDKNVAALREELNRIKKLGLNQDDMQRIMDSIKVNSSKNNSPTNTSPKNDKYKNEFKGNGKKRYGSIKNEKDGAEYEGATNAQFSVVLGMYKIFKYAKEYQKILLRDHQIETELVQLENAQVGYYYVTEKKGFNNLKDALTRLKQTREDLDKKTEKITNGQPWVLVTLTN